MSLFVNRVRSSSLDSSRPYQQSAAHDSGDISYTTNSLLDNGIVEPLSIHPLRRAYAFHDIAGSDPSANIHPQDIHINVACPQQNLQMQITVNTSITICKLKHQILGIWRGIDGSVQLAMHAKELSEHCTIQELGIAHGDTVQVNLLQQHLVVDWPHPIKRKSEDDVHISNKKTLVDR